MILEDMVLEVDGVNLTPYIAYGGYGWQREDIDGEGSGRDLTGELRRNRIAVKLRLDIVCTPLSGKNASLVLKTIHPEFVKVRFLDPEAGDFIERIMYSNRIPAKFLKKNRNGTYMWQGITFPLIEK